MPSRSFAMIKIYQASLRANMFVNFFQKLVSFPFFLLTLAHEKYFRVHTDSETAKYTSLATGKIAFLHIIYMNKSEGKGTQQGFFEYVEKFLSAETDDEKSR